MPFDMMYTVVAVGFFAVCAIAGDVLVRQRRHEGVVPGCRDGPHYQDHWGRLYATVPSPAATRGNGHLPHGTLLPGTMPDGRVLHGPCGTGR